jgi:uncharacterized DUF497 family protein
LRDAILPNWDFGSVSSDEQSGAPSNKALKLIKPARVKVDAGTANAGVSPTPSGEDRAIMMGHSDQGRLLLVIFTERADRIRIISAREAARRERHGYEEDAK